MAQDRFINLTLDPSASKKADKDNHSHGVSEGANSATGDFTISFDSSKVNSMNLLQSCMKAAVSSAACFLKS